jgi:hypothetical protein
MMERLDRPNQATFHIRRYSDENWKVAFSTHSVQI